MPLATLFALLLARQLMFDFSVSLGLKRERLFPIWRLCFNAVKKNVVLEQIFMFGRGEEGRNVLQNASRVWRQLACRNKCVRLGGIFQKWKNERADQRSSGPRTPADRNAGEAEIPDPSGLTSDSDKIAPLMWFIPTTIYPVCCDEFEVCCGAWSVVAVPPSPS
jgi:hypothetical protein